jgi:Holliday junction resolvase RusA-like endonuclease
VNEIQFIVPGEPVAKARARHRQITTKSGRSFVQSYTPKQTVSYEQTIADQARVVMHHGKYPVITAPVVLEVALLFSIPAGWPNWKRQAALEGFIAHTTKPDVDNVLKSVKDALNGICWLDDAQVVHVDAFKRYGERPGVRIKITPVSVSNCQITRKDQLIIPGQQEMAA